MLIGFCSDRNFSGYVPVISNSPRNEYKTMGCLSIIKTGDDLSFFYEEDIVIINKMTKFHINVRSKVAPKTIFHKCHFYRKILEVKFLAY